MTQVTVHIHPATAATLMSDAGDGPALVADAVRRAVSVLLPHGTRVAYAPLPIRGSLGCAMSVRRNRSGDVVVEIDAPGTLLRGRGVVRDREPAPRRR